MRRRLLRAELRKLVRPLTLAMVGAAFVITAIVVRQHVVNVSAGLGKGAGSARLRAELAPRALLESPLGIGKAAADEMASLVGAVVMLFLAGAHVAGEWSGRTLKSVLTAESRRGRVLVAKVASMWVAGVAVLAGLWLLLAAFTLFLAREWPIPGRPGPAAALRMAGPDLVRATLVIAVFAVLGLCAAVLTRSVLGTVLAGVLVLGIAMELGNIASLARFSPSYWVDGWMGFRPPGSGLAPLAMWNTGIPAGVPPAGVAPGVLGLAAFVAVLAAISWARFRRTDVTV